MSAAGGTAVANQALGKAFDDPKRPSEAPHGLVKFARDAVGLAFIGAA